jgi:hypothetical protein
MKKLIFVCGILFGIGAQSCTSKGEQSSNETGNEKELLMPVTLRDKGMFAQMTTNKGVINLVLEFQRAPLTVANFVGLAEGSIKNDEKDLGVPYYDGLVFHRVIKDFMIQGGCPQGSGQGDPGYKFAENSIQIYPILVLEYYRWQTLVLPQTDHNFSSRTKKLLGLMESILFSVMLLIHYLKRSSIILNKMIL